MQAHIFGPPVVAGRVLWNRICQSFHPPIHLSRHFLGIGILVFSKFWLCVRKPDKVVFDRVRFFLKKKKRKKNAPKMGKMGQKKGFLNLLKSLVIDFFWIWSMWSFILFAIFLCKSYIWEISGPWDVAQNSLGQLNCRIFKSTRTKQWNSLIADTNSWKVKVDWKILRWVWSKMGVANLVTGL